MNGYIIQQIFLETHERHFTIIIGTKDLPVRWEASSISIREQTKLRLIQLTGKTNKYIPKGIIRMKKKQQPSTDYLQHINLRVLKQ